MKKIILAGSAILGLALSGCTMYSPVSQPSGSAFHLELSRSDYKILGQGSGEACMSHIFNIPTGGKNTYQEAVAKAVGSKGGDLLIQSSSDTVETFFPSTMVSFWGERCITVTGTVVKLK